MISMFVAVDHCVVLHDVSVQQRERERERERERDVTCGCTCTDKAMIRMFVAVNHCVVGTCCVGTATILAIWAIFAKDDH